MPDLKTVTFDASQWQLVPKVPTQEMHAAGLRSGYDVKAVYTAMLAAAPTPAAQSAGQEATATAECWCETCQPSVGLNTRMVLCATCGNKRCPHATDCRLACTNSNESGQWGSSYGTRVIAAPVSGGTQGVWDVYAFGKWQRRVSAPVAWDAHAVYLDMVKNGWSKDIELRAISSENYSAPVNGGERDTVEVAVALEQQRTLAIVKAVRDINFGESPTGMPTPASAAYDLACEEIERRVRTEQWELDGVPAPLPSAERAADAQQASATNARLLRALEEIVKNDPFNQSSAGVIARAALTSPTKEQK